MTNNPWAKAGSKLMQRNFKGAVKALTDKPALEFFAKTAMSHTAKTAAVMVCAAVGTVEAGQQFRKTFDEIVQREPEAAPRPAREPAAASQLELISAAAPEQQPAAWPISHQIMNGKDENGAPEPTRPPSYRDLQTQCKEHGVSARGSAAVLQERLAALEPQ
jgi:hypothetical protein